MLSITMLSIVIDNIDEKQVNQQAKKKGGLSSPGVLEATID